MHLPLPLAIVDADDLFNVIAALGFNFGCRVVETSEAAEKPTSVP
jgi:hypothetical protein